MVDVFDVAISDKAGATFVLYRTGSQTRCDVLKPDSGDPLVRLNSRARVRAVFNWFFYQELGCNK
jgi:hypothetical protein